MFSFHRYTFVRELKSSQGEFLHLIPTDFDADWVHKYPLGMFSLVTSLPKTAEFCPDHFSQPPEARGRDCDDTEAKAKYSTKMLLVTAEFSFSFLFFLCQPFHPMVNLECSRDFRPFLCALYAPVCMEYGRVTLPCRRLCQRAHSECSKLMEMFGVSWPEDMECTRWGNPFFCSASNFTPIQDVLWPVKSRCFKRFPSRFRRVFRQHFLKWGLSSCSCPRKSAGLGEGEISKLSLHK